MNKQLRQQFIEFVNAQNDDRLVEHFSFASCAVGDFIRESIGDDENKEHGTYAEATAKKFLSRDEYLFLGNTLSNNLGNTYGELKVWVNSLEEV